MSLASQYQPQLVEPRLQAWWQETGVYSFSRDSAAPVYSIDTPPPTVSGFLHMGHVYSYTHADLMARFRRMSGYNVFYPMGFDDNGLPTERLVEQRFGIRAADVGRSAFIEKCLEISQEIEEGYKAVWQRLGLSIDWRYSYRTIDEQSQRASQFSFIDLYQKGLVYRREAPTIWCPECGTAIAQAELADLDRDSEFVTLAFELPDTSTLPIATTRPELLPACVAVFVHPTDARYRSVVGQRVRVPLFGQDVPVLRDPKADPEKGTGAVMCCTFGDVTDVQWWHSHSLPLRSVIGRDGRLTDAAGRFGGLSVRDARREVVSSLSARGAVLDRQPIRQSVRVHERCDTPVEYMVAPQWFIRVLDFKTDLLAAGEKVVWNPDHMKIRYREWVENLSWDWCISRQRHFGVPFPVWYCDACGESIVASGSQLPVDPTTAAPAGPCACGSTSFVPEQDVMDTWATSSLTPQIVGRWLQDPELYAKIFPLSLRPQAHEIIRTWAFYTAVKSHHHFRSIPWEQVAISGWALAPEGAGKISKSRGGGGGPITPAEAIANYSADAVRYWAASTGFGKDTVISEEKIAAGSKLVTKLWNVARFSERFIGGYQPKQVPDLSPADRWILSLSQRLVRRVTHLFERGDYAAAKSEIEAFFWRDLADNYIEMSKQRLYDEANPSREGARFALYTVVETIVKLFAPFLPYVTDEIFRELFANPGAPESVHRSAWPRVREALEDEPAEATGEMLVEIAGAVRRYKTSAGISLGANLQRVQLVARQIPVADALRSAEADLLSIARAPKVEIVEEPDPDLTAITLDSGVITVAVSH